MSDHDLSTGDRVTVSNPKDRRHGRRGRIARMDRGNVWVEFDSPALDFRSQETKAFRASSLRKLDVIERLAELVAAHECVEDNQGLCHVCGKVLNEDRWRER